MSEPSPKAPSFDIPDLELAPPVSKRPARVAGDQQVERAAVRLETHVRALRSYDAERARQGVIVVLSALGLLVLAILLKAVL